MSTSSTVKRSITRSLKALKEACQGIEDQHLLVDNHENEPEWGPSYSVEQKQQSLFAAQNVLATALESVSQRWEQTISDAGKLTDPERGGALMNEHQLHWKSQDGDDTILKAKNLLTRLQLAKKETVDISQQTSKDTKINSENPQNNSANNPLQTIPPKKQNQIEVKPYITPETSTNPHGALLSGNMSMKQSIRLPKFELPKFNGEVECFPEFWDVFGTTVHNNNSLPDTLKFLHLKNCLQGDAELVIRGLGMTEDSYNNTINLLHQRYYRLNFTRNALVNKLKDIKHATESAQSQRNTSSNHDTTRQT
ncbi:hypothetical protein Y032_0364g3562 [Ancylostoma ceylanicum]|uniref:Uncharacterized protein n=1 Tax=Ancylostoma ceylanicum TaxID=53326 RepID=A0A016RVU3_9BILA|nr:hypothetical protein Y032_0364g3562 [Ancylostoma ceylanicum]